VTDDVGQPVRIASLRSDHEVWNLPNTYHRCSHSVGLMKWTLLLMCIFIIWRTTVRRIL